MSGSPRSSLFEILLEGDEADSVLDFSDGVNPLLRVTDVGTQADLQVVGTLQAEDVITTGNAELGHLRCHPTYCPVPNDRIHIDGHLTEDLVVDDNMDGSFLRLRMTDPPELCPEIACPDRTNTISFPDETGIVLTSVSTKSDLQVVGPLESGSIGPGFGTIISASNIETVGTRTTPTCVGVAADPASTPNCAAAFAVKAPDVSASSCAPGCTYTPAPHITAVGTVTARDSFLARGDTYLGDSVSDQIVMRGLVDSYLHLGWEASEAYGPEIPTGIPNDDGTPGFTRLIRDKSMRIFFKRDAEGSKETVISARFAPSNIDSPPGERVITIPDVPSGGLIHISTTAFGRVQKGSTCATPNCQTAVQGKTPTIGVLIGINQVLMDVTAGIIEGPTGLKPQWEEQIGLVNRLIKPNTILVANIHDPGGNGMPHMQAVHVDPEGGKATMVIRNIAVDPTDVVDQAYKISWMIAL